MMSANLRVRTSLLLLALSIVFLSGAARADELALKTNKDWAQLFQSCESDWSEYDAKIDRMRATFKRDIDKMTEKEYLARWKADDPMIRFVQIHWPAIFEKKDSGWNFYKNCADLNWSVRKSLGSETDSRAEKEKKIGAFSTCIGDMYSRNRKPPPPFDLLIKCYSKKAMF